MPETTLTLRDCLNETEYVESTLGMMYKVSELMHEHLDKKCTVNGNEICRKEGYLANKPWFYKISKQEYFETLKLDKINNESCDGDFSQCRNYECEKSNYCKKLSRQDDF